MVVAAGVRLMIDHTPMVSDARIPTVSDADTEMPRARDMLITAEMIEAPVGRFESALTAAGLAAAAVLRVRPVHDPAREVWRGLATTVPELGEWAGFFMACQQRVRPGAIAAVTARQADDLVRDAQRFCDEVTRWLSRHQSPRMQARA